jgi:dipeptidyl aminopeptidase/acylaminoacyl peptidase
VALSFVNRTAGKVVVYWMDFEGHRKKYVEIAPGGRHTQPTYAGHIWVLTDGADGVYAAFETPDDGGELVLDAAMKPMRVSRAAPDAPVRSPDGRRLAFVRGHNVYLRDARGGGDFALSHDGNADDSYAQEDLYWSPDATHLVAVRTKKGDDRKVYLIESSPADGLQPKLSSYDYLKPGDRIPVPWPQLFDVAARARVSVDDRLFAQPWSVSEVRWSPDSRRFTFLYNQRGHQTLRVVAVDAHSGETRALVDEQSRTFIDYSGKFYYRLLDASHEILWMSERDGYNHLYLYDADTGLVKSQITRGEWVVRRVVRVDEKRRRIWLFAGGVRPGQDPYYLHLCRVNFDGSDFTVLTEGDGTHTADFSPDERFFVDTWSRVDQPPVTELRSAVDGKIVRELERADAGALLATGWTPPERFVAKGRDGATDIYGIILRPRHFDASKKYPVIEDIYAGPTGAFVPKAFGIADSTRELAERGFILVQIDGMGTSFRSHAFQQVAWKNLADAGFPDRIAWMKAAAARHPEMDLSRVGIYGGSAGGQNAMRALLSHGDFYKVAVADSGCHDNRMDKIWWNELWMGWPVDDSYARSSNVVDAHKLQGKLMLIVGELDHNVDPSSTMQVVHALIEADKDFELLVIPGGGHGVAETPYGRRRRAEFFERYLLGGRGP